MNPLASGSLAMFMASSLSKEVSPQLKAPCDAVALACHAGMLAVGFKLKGLGEDHKLEANSEANDPQPLPSEWNKDSTIAFRYSHPQSAMEFILKVGRLGNKAVIDAIAVGADQRTSFDLPVADYISPSALPATPLTSDTSEEQAARNLIDVFISESRLADLGVLLKLKVVQKLAPSLHKEGYEEERDEDERSARRAPSPRPGADHGPAPGRGDPQPARPNPFPYDDPLAAPPRRPYPPGLEPPGFEDEYDILRAPGRSGPSGFRSPYNIGERDLYPQGLGPNDPFRPSIGGLPRPGGGGGMHPTFDDPLFGGRGSEGYGGGASGGDPMAPFGARYDPVGPGDPRAGRGFPGAGHRGPGGGPHNPFGRFGGGDFI